MSGLHDKHLSSIYLISGRLSVYPIFFFSSFFVLMRTRVVVHLTSLREPWKCLQPSKFQMSSVQALLAFFFFVNIDDWSLGHRPLLHLGELPPPKGTPYTQGNSLHLWETLISLLLYTGFIETIGFTWLGQRTLCKQRLDLPCMHTCIFCHHF